MSLKSGKYYKNVGFRYDNKFNVSSYNQLYFNYHSKFFGSLIFRGRKLFAYKMMLDLKHALKIREGVDPCLVFLVAMLRITPEISLRFVKMGGSRQGIPAPISGRKRITFAVRWVIKLLRDKDRTRRVTVDSIAELLCGALRNKGDSIKKKQDFYRVASGNRHLIYRYLR